MWILCCIELNVPRQTFSAFFHCSFVETNGLISCDSNCIIEKLTVQSHSKGQHASTCVVSLCLVVLAPFVFTHSRSNVSSGFSVFYLRPMLKSKHIVQEECTLSIIHTVQCDRIELSWSELFFQTSSIDRWLALLILCKSRFWVYFWNQGSICRVKD